MTSRTTSAGAVQTYAIVAGILGLISIAVGAFGEAYVPATLVATGNSALTASNIMASETLFRWGFAAYLIEALCDVGLTFLFFLLFRPVSKDLALLSVLFRLTGTAVFAMAQVFHFSMLPVARAGQLDDIGLFIVAHKYGVSMSMLFYGVGTVTVGYLIYKAEFLPRWLGFLFALGGAGFALSSWTWVLAPAFSSPLLMVPGGVAALALSLWLLLRGVDTVKWNEKAAAPAGN